MENCSNLFALSAIACRLAACLSEKELTELAADLMYHFERMYDMRTERKVFKVVE